VTVGMLVWGHDPLDLHKSADVAILTTSPMYGMHVRRAQYHDGGRILSATI